MISITFGGGLTPLTEMQWVYSTTPADWARIPCDGFAKMYNLYYIASIEYSNDLDELKKMLIPSFLFLEVKFIK